MKHAAGTIVISDGKVLLVRAGKDSLQVDGSLSFPGGHIEAGESLEETAKRELQEEAGLTAEELIDFPNNYVEATVERKDGLVAYSFKVYLVTQFRGELRATNETEPLWMNIEQARKTNLYGQNNLLLEHVLEYLKERE